MDESSEDENTPGVEEKAGSSKQSLKSLTNIKTQTGTKSIRQDEEEDVDEEDHIDEYDEEDEEAEEDEDDDEDDDDIVSSLKSKVVSDLGTTLDIQTNIDFGDNTSIQISPPASDVEEDDDEYLQKFDSKLHYDYIKEYHQESIINNYNEVNILTNAPHKTIPFLTKYERTRILGLRTKQINSGSKPFIELAHNIIDGYLIAELELKAKKIPFIIRRPLPDNTSEYWKLSDLELI